MIFTILLTLLCNFFGCVHYHEPDFYFYFLVNQFYLTKKKEEKNQIFYQVSNLLLTCPWTAHYPCNQCKSGFHLPARPSKLSINSRYSLDLCHRSSNFLFLQVSQYITEGLERARDSLTEAANLRERFVLGTNLMSRRVAAAAASAVITWSHYPIYTFYMYCEIYFEILLSKMEYIVNPT